jgi:hypothetical protein
MTKEIVHACVCGGGGAGKKKRKNLSHRFWEAVINRLDVTFREV